MTNFEKYSKNRSDPDFFVTRGQTEDRGIRRSSKLISLEFNILFTRKKVVICVIDVDVNWRFHAIFQSFTQVTRSPGDHSSPPHNDFKAI